MRFSLKPRKDRSLPVLIFVSFLGMFVVSRLFTSVFPDFYLSRWIGKGIHVHHFAYGIVAMSGLGVVSLLVNLSTKGRQIMCVLFGMALGMAYDEFAMWLQLEDNYYDRMNYDAVVVISLIFVNIIYFLDFWKAWGKRGVRLVGMVVRRVGRRPRKMVNRLE